MWGRFRVKIFRAFRRKCILTNNCCFSVVTDDYNDLSNTKREQFYSCYSKSRLVNELCMRRSNCSATIPSSRAPLGTSLFLWLPWSFYRFFQPCPALLNHFQMLGFNASYPQEFSYAPPPVYILLYDFMKIMRRTSITMQWKYCSSAQYSIQKAR